MSYREYRSPKRQERERKERRKRKRDTSDFILSPPDNSLIIIVIFLVVIGFLAIFSATAPKCLREGVSLISFLWKQMLFAGIGVGAMCFLMNYDYKKLEKHNKTFLWIVIGLLLILQFTPLGVTINGAKRWINLVVFQLQPSELAKPLFCMLLASLFKDKINLNTLLKNLWVVIPMALIILLILKQPNLSMANYFINPIINGLSC